MLKRWRILLVTLFILSFSTTNSDDITLTKDHDKLGVITSGRNVTSSWIITTTTTANSVERIDDEQPMLSASIINNSNVEVVTVAGGGPGGVNITGYLLENDDADTSFTDVQTLVITCAFTIGCLVLTLVLGFTLRFCWRVFIRNRDAEAYDTALNKDESSAPLKGNLTLSADELKTAESQFSISCGASGVPGNDLDGGGTSPMLTYSGASSRTTNHASANGSIITMTLKNNHLIVETEERNDIVENSRETTMKYSPSNHDGVFVVEVQQGVRRVQNYPTMTCSSPEEVSRSSSDHQRALVHHPPAEVLTDAEEDATPGDDTFTCIRSGTNTGLSQSDLSESSNNSYRYGNQQEYGAGHYGYPIYSGYTTDTPNTQPLDPIKDPDKPVITAAIYKASSSPNQNVLQSTNSIDMSEITRRASLCYEPLLMSDVQAKERFTTDKNNKLRDDIIQEEQKALGNGQLTEEGNKEVKTDKFVDKINTLNAVVQSNEKGPLIDNLKEKGHEDVATIS